MSYVSAAKSPNILCGQEHFPSPTPSPTVLHVPALRRARGASCPLSTQSLVATTAHPYNNSAAMVLQRLPHRSSLPKKKEKEKRKRRADPHGILFSLSAASHIHILSDLSPSKSIPPSTIRVKASHAPPIAADTLRLSLRDASTPALRPKDDGPAPISPEKLDFWMRESVTEIVREIEEAPFLAYIFHDESVRLEKEKTAAEKDWGEIKRRWEESSIRTPDGVILVEELSSGTTTEKAERSKRRWGVVVQGRGRGAAECSACYILDTCRVRSAIGASTHFCLVRAQCFGDSADVQIKRAWIFP